MCLNIIKRFRSERRLLFLLFVNQNRLKSCDNFLNQSFYSISFNNKINNRCLSTNTYDWLQRRGIVKNHFPEKENINELLSSNQTIYAGFDATADSLHVGNLLVLIALLNLQRLGHQVIVLIGDSTARIGDPSGKTEDRPLIDKNLIQKYADSIEKSVLRIFENHEKYFWKARGRTGKLQQLIICRNSEWYSDKNVIDFMSTYGRYLRVTTMIGKTIKERLETTGLCLSEFAYQLFQSYDFLHLHKKYGTLFQIGGIDQTVNIHCGHDLIRRVTGKQALGMFVPILTNEKGKKFGKTEEKAVYLNEQRTSPYNLYQFLQRQTDTQIHDLMKMFSFRSDTEIEQMFQKQLRDPKPWYLQTKLAEEVTLLVHGEAGLSSAKRTTEALFKKDINALAKLSESEINDVFEGAVISKLFFTPDEMTALDLGLKANCFNNELEALRMIKGGGFYINYQKVDSPQQILTQKDILENSITLVSVGKRTHHIVKWY